MVKRIVKKIGLALMALFLVQLIAFAQGTSGTEPDSPQEASFKSRCDDANAMKFPDCADSPADCASEPFGVTSSKTTESGTEYTGVDEVNRTPFNCIFLWEPIGGEPGYDLYRITPHEGGNIYTLWYGEAIVGNDTGPVQAILAYEPGNELQGPFGVVYSYLGLVYNFLSGIIIAFVVLIAIIGGIRMTTSAGNQEQFTAGKNMIIKALIGMVIWFTASVILYTINPTFFSF